jgi:PTS system ascorbate-specific IIA component
MKDINLLESLIKNDSILLNQDVINWKEAVNLCTKPLLASKAITKNYSKSIIKNVEKFGPYFIISDNVAMPHARPEDGVNKNAFSLITLNKSIKFESDDREIRVLICLSAVSNDIHVSSALPQVVAVFEDENRVYEIINAKTKKEVIEIIEKVDFSKYL